MGKRVLYVILLTVFTLPFVLAGGAEVKDLTGDAFAEITGEVPTNIAVEILSVSPPMLNLTKPVNGTYFQNNSIPLDFTVMDEIFIWYNLDKGTNITITGPLTFETSEGSHELFLFANNSFGTVSESVNFSINETLLTVLYEEFNANLRGNSVDFYNLSFEELQALSGLVLENSDHGRIGFNEAINVTDDGNYSDFIVDIDINVNISFNRVYLNSSGLPSFNKSATIRFYNLVFSNPKPVIDLDDDGEFEDCPASICTEQSFFGGTFIFNVTHFTTYSSEETPSVSPGPGGGGGGATRRELVVTPQELRIELLEGGEEIKVMRLENKGNTQLSLDVSQVGLDGFVSFPEGTSVVLAPGQREELTIAFESGEEVGVFTGSLVFEDTGVKEEVPVVIIVESEGEIGFDLAVSIPDEYKNVQPGMVIPLRVEMSVDGEPVQGEISYFVRDLFDNFVVEITEDIEIKDRIFLKEIELPGVLIEENYVLYAVLNYKNETAIAAAPLLKYELPLPAPIIQPVNSMMVFLIFLFVLVVIFVHFKKKHRRKHSIVELALGRKI